MTPYAEPPWHGVHRIQKNQSGKKTQNVLRSFSLREPKGDKGDKIRAKANYTDIVNVYFYFEVVVKIYL